MPQFILRGAQTPAFQTLDEFTQAYIEAAFFTEEAQLNAEAEAHFEDDVYVHATVGIPDLAPETLATMIADCAKFQADNSATLSSASVATRTTLRECDSTQAGHDFWLTRNGHGAGFWDGDWPEPYATQLDEAAKAFGECSLYVGDDQLIYAQ